MNSRRTIFSSAALTGLAACATAPGDPALLAQAREAVRKAEADPGVARYAAADLDRARQLLLVAENATRRRGADARVGGHYAYLTTQVARIAEQRAHEQLALMRLEAGETERQQILATIPARTTPEL